MNLLFIGDSITEGFDAKKYLSEYYIYNAGVSGDNTLDVLSRINTEWFKIQPDITFLCIGTNDIAQGFGDIEIINNIQEIVFNIREFLDNDNIYLVPVFPTRHNPPRSNDRIRMLNEKIKFLSEQIDCKYLDSKEKFSDEHGAMKRGLTNDGLHLTDKAYELFAELIKEVLK
jgi:lysophospholipase L1-like esterase